ncbi:MAG: PAS domain-containing sensor histidine kinase [Rhodanobacter denitrificans]|uniref:histidine kinase n=1 Tax=Rhodanobacter denitrificans TaxID=666685 RepID=A0A2W5M518_9GAMM|nr:MAG: PAS domain-containing sensor histidine kinase [Rhodanobacter denitrificans]
MPAQYARSVRSVSEDAAGILEGCVSGMALVDDGLDVLWLNPAMAERFGALLRRRAGAERATLDLDNDSLAEAAQRARLEGRTVLLRQARLGDGSGGELIGDAAFTPFGDALLFEWHGLPAAADAAAPALSASLRGFAHEVKNPLAGLRGAAQLLKRYLDDPDQAELAELIIDEADRLAALADRLLRAGGKPRLARINPHELLERVAALIGAETGAPQIRRDYDPSVPPIHGDRDRLHQLLLNLARNAVEAGATQLTLRSRVEHGVRLAERRRHLALRIDLIDDGRGVPAELADTLFQPLVSGRPDGTGLGLALAQEIAREHGGDLRHLGRPGATTFTLMLPVNDDD